MPESHNARRKILTRQDARDIREDVLRIQREEYGGAVRGIDWCDFADLLEDLGYDLGVDLETEAMREIRRIVRGTDDE